jgi:hypothetical protein
LNDGKGFVFVSHTSEVFPSGFLPFAAGNVLSESLTRIYRESPVFQQLGEADQIGGKYVPEFRHICGGSRARAFALTGDPMAEEPCCAYGKELRPANAPSYSLQASSMAHKTSPPALPLFRSETRKRQTRFATPG